MVSKRTWFLLLAVLAALALLAAQCGATPTPERIVEKVVETVVVEKEVAGETVTVVETVEVEVVKEVPVEKEVVVTATPEPVEEPLILRVGQNAADLSSLDPHFATTTEARALVDMIFNGLLRYKPGDGAFESMEPDLAEALPEMEMVGDQQVWTFKLRQGVMCHPAGNIAAYELTSEDVVYSLEKSATAERSAYAGEYTGMTFEAVDDYTVKITLDAPLSPVLFYPKVANYSGGFVVCKQAVEALGDDKFKTFPVGTGPFMFESYSPQEKIMLKANPDYFRGAPKIDGVEYRYMADISSREAGLLAGELDVINGIPDIVWVDKIQGEEGVSVDVFGVGEVATLHFNTTVPPLDNPEVRKALAYALDRDEFLALFGEPVAENVYSPVPAKFLAGGLTREEVEDLGLAYDVDRDLARQMLADAGYADGFSLEVVTSEMTGYRRLYENMQAQLAEVGVDLAVNVVDHSTMHSQIREDVNPLVIYIAWRPNADVYLTRFFHSDSIVVTGAKPDTNFSHIDILDDVIESARVATDADEQIALWKDAQITILEDMYAYPLQFQQQVYARSDKVDYGHDLVSVLALYPGITENTTLER
jgi:peptide/nickel transport system substrate-binding protein